MSLKVLFVLCWCSESRLDDNLMGVGYTIHPSKDASATWDHDRLAACPGFDPSGYLLFSRCGAGTIMNPSEELVNQLGAQDGLFMEEQPNGFVLTSGKTPEQIDEEMLEEVGS